VTTFGVNAGRVLGGRASEAERVSQFALMCVIRAFEERIRELKLAGDVTGSVHLEIGQESVAVGVCTALKLPDDVVFATYRGHGWALSCGSSPRLLMAEVLGREVGLNGGRAGSAYLTDPSVGFMGENSIVGGGASHAVGAALQGQFDGTARRAIAVMGDGALNQGAVHEAINFAAYRRLPVAFVVENNGYSEMTPIGDMVAESRLWMRASGYGIPGVRIDGNDISAVTEQTRQWRRQTDPGPILIEAMTQRLVGHYVGDPEMYRTAEEITALAAVEPIQRLKHDLLDVGVPAVDLEAVAADATGLIDEAAKWALEQVPAHGDTARDHVHA
jgi:TPP-dependent pyruvate/acetoin dehydrogenase alpha subunit